MYNNTVGILTDMQRPPWQPFRRLQQPRVPVEWDHTWLSHPRWKFHKANAGWGRSSLANIRWQSATKRIYSGGGAAGRGVLGLVAVSGVRRVRRDSAGSGSLWGQANGAATSRIYSAEAAYNQRKSRKSRSDFQGDGSQWSKHGLWTPNEDFFLQNSNFVGLDRQFGQVNFGAFGVFLADLSTSILILGTVRPLSMFSINQPLSLQRN